MKNCILLYLFVLSLMQMVFRAGHEVPNKTPISIYICHNLIAEVIIDDRILAVKMK